MPGVIEDLDALAAAGLAPVVEAFARRGLPAVVVADEVDFIWWTSIGEEIGRLDPRLGEHDGGRLRAALADYVARTQPEALDRVLTQIAGVIPRMTPDMVITMITTGVPVTEGGGGGG